MFSELEICPWADLQRWDWLSLWPNNGMDLWRRVLYPSGEQMWRTQSGMFPLFSFFKITPHCYFGIVTQRNLFQVYSVPYWVLSLRKQPRRRINGYVVINICPGPRCRNERGGPLAPSFFPADSCSHILWWRNHLFYSLSIFFNEYTVQPKVNIHL